MVLVELGLVVDRVLVSLDSADLVTKLELLELEIDLLADTFDLVDEEEIVLLLVDFVDSKETDDESLPVSVEVNVDGMLKVFVLVTWSAVVDLV